MLEIVSNLTHFLSLQKIVSSIFFSFESESLNNLFLFSSDFIWALIFLQIGLNSDFI